MGSNRICLLQEFRYFLRGYRFAKQKSLYGFTTYFLDKFKLVWLFYTFRNHLLAKVASDFSHRRNQQFCIIIHHHVIDKIFIDFQTIDVEMFK